MDALFAIQCMPKFHLWFSILQLEHEMMIIFVKSLRESDLSFTQIYCHILFLILNHTHYARWISGHLRD